MLKASVPGGWPAKCHFGTGVGKRFAERGGGGVTERGSRDRAFINWQSEDQAWLRTE